MFKLNKFILLFFMLSVYFQFTPVFADNYQWYKVVNIIDGDTLTISYNGRTEKVRLFGIDAPERYQYGYFKAGALLEELCFHKLIRLEYPSKNRRDKFGRILAKIYLQDGNMVNQLLLEKGVVKLYKRDPLIITK